MVLDMQVGKRCTSEGVNLNRKNFNSNKCLRLRRRSNLKLKLNVFSLSKSCSEQEIYRYYRIQEILVVEKILICN